MYCIRCGKKLPGEYNQCRVCPPTERAGRWYCPHCGEGVKQTQTVCDVCGGELDFSPDSVVMTDPVPPKQRIPAALLAFFAGAFGAHFYYLAFPERFRKRLVWALVSIGISVASLILFRSGMERAFVNGEYVAEIARELTGFAVTAAVGIVGGALSFALAFITGIVDGVVLLRRKSYLDGNGNTLA